MTAPLLTRRPPPSADRRETRRDEAHLQVGKADLREDLYSAAAVRVFGDLLQVRGMDGRDQDTAAGLEEGEQPGHLPRRAACPRYNPVVLLLREGRLGGLLAGS